MKPAGWIKEKSIAGAARRKDLKKGCTMTKGVVARVWFGICLGCFSSMAAQLEPEVEVDLHWLQAERLMKEGNRKKALDKLMEICKLEKDQQKWPDGFHMRFAKIALAGGQVRKAIDIMESYFSGFGRKDKQDKHYGQMLELLDKAIQAQKRVVEQGKCVRHNKCDSCWKDVNNYPGCHVWISYLQPCKKVTWTGRCFGGLADGRGTLKWICSGCGKTWESTGSFTLGKQHGHWVERESNGKIREEGPYVEGKRHGHWVELGSRGEVVKEGRYENGKKQGEWIERIWVTYKNGKKADKCEPEQLESRCREVRVSCD